MWLITTIMAAITVTAIWLLRPKKNLRLDALAMMLWGLGVMILVDHVLGYEGGAFFETETDGLVANGALLGLLMLLPVIAIWAVYLGVSNRKQNTLKE